MECFNDFNESNDFSLNYDWLIFKIVNSVPQHLSYLFQI